MTNEDTSPSGKFHFSPLAFGIPLFSGPATLFFSWAAKVGICTGAGGCKQGWGSCALNYPCKRDRSGVLSELSSSPPLLAVQATGMGSGQEEVVEWELGLWAWTHKWKGKIICKIKSMLVSKVLCFKSLLGFKKIFQMEMPELCRLSWVQTVNFENTKVFQTST